MHGDIVYVSDYEFVCKGMCKLLRWHHRRCVYGGLCVCVVNVYTAMRVCLSMCQLVIQCVYICE